jgi:hypothetical protein
MFTRTHRSTLAVLFTCGAWLTAGLPLALACGLATLTPQEISDKGFEGKAIVELKVAEVTLAIDSWAVDANERWKAVPLRLEAKLAGTTNHVMVLISPQVVARLKQLGIENPADHFQGKVIRVMGTVQKQITWSGIEYRLPVTSLDQLDTVRKG